MEAYLNIIIFFFLLFKAHFVFAAAKIDEDQNTKINELMSLIEKQDSKINKLESKIKNQKSMLPEAQRPIQKSSLISQPTQDDLKIAEIKEKILNIQRAVKNGLDLDIVTDQLVKLRADLDQLQNKKNQSPESSISTITDKPTFEGLHFGGELSFDAIKTKNYDDSKTSDFVVSSLELSMQKNFTKSTDGTISFLYEQNSSEFDVDQAFVSSRWGNEHLITATFGLKGIPVGVFDSAFTSDTLINGLLDASYTTLMLSYNWKNFSVGFFAYNGQSSKLGESDSIKSFGNFFQYENTELYMGFLERFRISYLRRASDTSLFYEKLDDTATPNTNEALELSKIPGIWDAQTKLALGPINLIAEYAFMKKGFSENDLAFNSQGAKISSWQSEIAYEFIEKWWAQFGYQGTNQAVALSLPKESYLTGVSWEVNDFMNVNLEHKINKDYETTDCTNGSLCGTGEKENVTTLQLKIVFL